MKGWLSDLVRLLRALFYWNARKTAYVWRGRRGRCPCQNLSDSGRAMVTECEAVVLWHRPERFRRVCPLLACNADGQWVCSVPAAQVRPFWGRALGLVGRAILMLLLAAGLATMGLMRGVGYAVTWRQVFWPGAWSEINGVRARFFVRQAETNYTKGLTRQAMANLETALQLEPDNYPAGMRLAQLDQVGNLPTADQIYKRLLHRHPEHRAEICRTWFRSLLSRGRLAEAAALSSHELTGDTGEAAAWVNALIFAVRHLRQPDLLEAAAIEPRIDARVRAVLSLAAKVEQAPTAAARHSLLTQTPLVEDFPYDRVYRISRLIAEGYPGDALNLLAVSSHQLGGRDVARLALAAYSAAGDSARVEREFVAFLVPGRALQAPELTLLALHLITYPDPRLLSMLVNALERIKYAPADERIEAILTVFCAAGVEGNLPDMKLARDRLAADVAIGPNLLRDLQLFFIKPAYPRQAAQPIPQLSLLSLECTYAILDRYIP
jgi:tetratricopeptide (TPR) repeat protein